MSLDCLWEDAFDYKSSKVSMFVTSTTKLQNLINDYKYVIQKTSGNIKAGLLIFKLRYTILYQNVVYIK
jgi:hypothetical protein